MAEPGRGRSGMSLREGALVVFSLVAVVPILLFIYLLSSANLLHRTDVQVGLVLAIVVSGLGFAVFRRMVGQIARLADGFQGVRASAIATAAPDDSAAEVPGLGQVTEIGQVTGAFYQMLEDLRGATQRLEDLVFKLGTLNETVDLAARIPQIQDLLGKVLQTTMRAVHATGGSIMILDRERQFLSQAASRGAFDETAPVAPIKLGEGIAGKVVERGEPVLVDDVEADPRFGEPAPFAGRGAFLCMPIRAGDRVIGVINMMKHAAQGGRAQSFSATDVQFLNALMTYIGYAVDNARLLEDAQQSARRLQSVVDDLRTTQEQLVRGETLRALGQLSSGMAHHLNNLFAVIQGRSELLLGSASAPNSRRSLEIIRRAAQDGADVARRVQRFSRLQPVAEPVAADLNRLVLDVVALTEPRRQDPDGNRAQEIAVDVQAGEVPPVICEIAPLREALVNLLLNAADAMPDGGTITVRTWVDGGRVRCSVTDTGVGMSEEVCRRALEPFFTTKGAKRTGLGLSVAYGAVQRYGGSLEIRSEPGVGTAVTLNLPIAAPAAVPEAGPEIAAPGTGLKVLIIDDEAEARDVLAEILEGAGHCVVKTARGEEGVGRLQGGESFDLVLTDLLMPGMSGWDVARVLQQSWPRLPVGLVTAWSEQTMTPEERTRVDLVITKPFEPERVRATLAGLTRRAS